MSTALSKCRFLCDDKKKMSTVYIMTVDLLTVDILMASRLILSFRSEQRRALKQTHLAMLITLQSTQHPPLDISKYSHYMGIITSGSGLDDAGEVL